LRLSQIQEQIANGEYRVDAHAVAEAILRRLLDGQIRAPNPAQAECS
jgi:Anti-sigma-28 factor, FlgM